MHVTESHAYSFASQINIKMSSAESVPKKNSGLHHGKTPRHKKYQEQEMRAFYE
jgi:hypothetical protein